MTRPYKLSTREIILPNHPLHWSKFWPDLQRVHRSRAEARQDLVLWIANLYHGAIRSGRPFGFCAIQVRLMDLRELVRDYRPALEHFFEIRQLGFHFNEDHMELSTLVPKKLRAQDLSILEETAEDLRYSPPALPSTSIISKVYLRTGLDREALVKKLLETGRPEIIPQLTWLLKQPPELNFHFVPSGRLKLRDTSIWPISGIETWPSWIREELFGIGIDLDSAYVQFLLVELRSAFAGRTELLQTLFPDLIRLLEDKEAFRKELCTQVLHQPYDEKHKSLIKQIIMSLANGSRISPALLTNGSGFSLTADLINEASPDASTLDLTLIGERLHRIAQQFASAKKFACMTLLKKAPNRANVKKVFSSYFSWERAARYALWEEVGRHGIMVHDGLDGVPAEHLARLPEIMENLGLKLTA
jgi:hypothetical protein